jgi:flap endonuclease-1
MGINLNEIVKKQLISLPFLSNKSIAIDAYNALYQFLSIIRQPDGTPLKDSKDRVTSHLAGLLYRTSNLVEVGIKPIYVFDGAPHPLKVKTLEGRRAIKEKATFEWKKAIEAGDLELARMKAQQTSRLSKEMIVDTKKLLDALGLPWTQAPSEGEAQASWMAAKGKVYACASQDFDSLLFGSPLLVRNLAITGKRKLPRRKAWVNIQPELIDLEQSLKNLGVSKEQLVDVAILMGTDFNEGIKGIGPKSGVKLVKQKGSLEKVLAELRKEKKLSISEETISSYQEIREIFLKPEVITPPKLIWRRADRQKVEKLLCDEHQFSLSRVENALKKYEVFGNRLDQANLFEF